MPEKSIESGADPENREKFEVKEKLETIVADIKQGVMLDEDKVNYFFASDDYITFKGWNSELVKVFDACVAAVKKDFPDKDVVLDSGSPVKFNLSVRKKGYLHETEFSRENTIYQRVKYFTEGNHGKIDGEMNVEVGDII